MTRIVENVSRMTLEVHIVENVRKGATVSTDELKSYARLARLGYKHGAVNHATGRMGARRATNSLEGFWSLLKRSIQGTHVHVSRRHLAKYLSEFEFLWNSRHAPAKMFPRLLSF